MRIEVPIEKLWLYPIGCRVIVKDELKGFYIGRSNTVDNMIMIWNEIDGLVYWEDDEEFEGIKTCIVFPLHTRLDIVLKCKIANVLELVNEGWGLEGRVLNLSDALEELELFLRVYKAVVNG